VSGTVNGATGGRDGNLSIGDRRTCFRPRLEAEYKAVRFDRIEALRKRRGNVGLMDGPPRVDAQALLSFRRMHGDTTTHNILL
jgi:hypothetical protein